MIVAGNDNAVAAEAAGITRMTFHRWIERGKAAEPGDEAFVAFLENVEEARAIAEAARVEAIASSKSWQAHAWILERQYPERWSKPSERNKDGEGSEGGGFFDELADRRERRAGGSSGV
jgi:hypothetical protein